MVKNKLIYHTRISELTKKLRFDQDLFIDFCCITRINYCDGSKFSDW